MSLQNNLQESNIERAQHFLGVVVDNKDPEFRARCKVRVFGIFDDVKDEDLPWAFPMNPINNTRHFEAPSLGEWVVGFFIDSEAGQSPIMMGVIPGIKRDNDYE